jgi:restriction system protein
MFKYIGYAFFYTLFLGFLHYANIIFNVLPIPDILLDNTPTIFNQQIFRWYNEYNIFVLSVTLGVFCFFLAAFLRFRRILRPRFRVKIADKQLKKIRSFSGGNLEIRVINYLRKIDHFVFEEMLLTCFKEKGYKIKRNKAYTGDGGIDGTVWINRKKHLIQAKRYSNYISLQHMKDFINVCEKFKTRGIFAHTGKMGKETRNEAMNNNIIIIENKEIVELIMKKTID